MSFGTGARIGLLVFVVAVFQVSAFATMSIAGGAPDVLLVTLVAIALLRGAITGAVTGFFAGLIVDVATLATLGLTSLLYTLAGFWAGRYGETTGRGRVYAPYLTVALTTVFMTVGSWMLDAVLGDPVSLRTALPGLPAAVVWNVVLMAPIRALVRRLVGEAERLERTREVELLV